MGAWKRLKYLWPSHRRREEREMREEMESLAAIAGAKELGNLTLAMEDARRAVWGWTWLDSVAADVRYSLRSLRSQPAFFLLAVFSLALAIGANSAIFSFADALLLRPLPVPNASGLFDVSSTTPDNPFEGMSFPDYSDLREKSTSFSGLAAYRLTQLAAATGPATPARIQLAVLASDNFFPLIGVLPAAGRTFLPSEASAPGQPVAIISYGYWRQNWGDRSALGGTLRLNGILFTIVGVTPERFNGLDLHAQPTIYVPLGMWQRLSALPSDPLEDRGRHELVVKARLAPGVTEQSAQAGITTIGAALEREYPKTNHNRHPAIRTELTRRIQRTPQLLALVKMLLALVGLILIIACSNLASLLLARGRARGREIAIRLSIGAGRLRLVRQLMTESLIVALLGGAVGLLFAYTGILLLQTLSVPTEPPSPLGVELDWRVVAFSFCVALLSCVLFGLAPAWQAVRLNFVNALKAGGHGVSGDRRTFTRDVLVAGQIALAMVVLIAAGMFLAGFRKMLATTPEFRVDHVISMDTAPTLLHYTAEQTRAFYRRLVDRVRTMPGVDSVAMTESLPLATSQTVVTSVPEGYRMPKGREKVVTFGAAVDAGYFSTMRVEIVRGRAFTEDDRAGSHRVAIVNQQFAKTYWPNQDPIGRRIRLDTAGGPEAEVVGVAKTGHYFFINEAPEPYVYLPYDQNPRPRMTVIVQSAGDAAALSAPLRDMVRSIDPNLPVFNLRPVAALYESRATGTWLQFFQMVGTLGFIGLVLAMTGLYGLIAYTVSRRVKEFGIRVALGAGRSDVVWLVERRGLILAAAGIGIGGLCTSVAMPLLSAGFFGLRGTSPAVYFVVPVMLLAVSAIASYLPARRAAALDPVRALRNE